MMLVRWVLKAQRGGWLQVCDALKRASDRGGIPFKPYRISSSRFGTLYQIAIEWEIENYAAVDSLDWRSAQGVWAEIHPYLESGDTLETWEIVASSP